MNTCFAPWIAQCNKLHALKKNSEIMCFMSSHNCNRGKLQSQIFLKLLSKTQQKVANNNYLIFYFTNKQLWAKGNGNPWIKAHLFGLLCFINVTIYNANKYVKTGLWVSYWSQMWPWTCLHVLWSGFIWKSNLNDTIKKRPFKYKYLNMYIRYGSCICIGCFSEGQIKQL